MTPSRPPYVRFAIWDEGLPTETPGVNIWAGPGFAFIPTEHLRRIADQLHDAADTLEAGQ